MYNIFCIYGAQTPDQMTMARVKRFFNWEPHQNTPPHTQRPLDMETAMGLLFSAIACIQLEIDSGCDISKIKTFFTYINSSLMSIHLRVNALPDEHKELILTAVEHIQAAAATASANPPGSVREGLREIRAGLQKLSEQFVINSHEFMATHELPLPGANGLLRLTNG
jgi:hypothetical protein